MGHTPLQNKLHATRPIIRRQVTTSFLSPFFLLFFFGTKTRDKIENAQLIFAIYTTHSHGVYFRRLTTHKRKRSLLFFFFCFQTFPRSAIPVCAQLSSSSP
ncbi:hypothetical protein QBC44DRAFT_316243 [Cladorrhinum sp. PSN332]|nr:hypothetical protein QBC44DRAFT_316243 [Cladorrhinum sp. PSN332]